MPIIYFQTVTELFTGPKGLPAKDQKGVQKFKELITCNKNHASRNPDLGFMNSTVTETTRKNLVQKG